MSNRGLVRSLSFRIRQFPLNPSVHATPSHIEQGHRKSPASRIFQAHVLPRRTQKPSPLPLAGRDRSFQPNLYTSDSPRVRLLESDPHSACTLEVRRRRRWLVGCKGVGHLVPTVCTCSIAWLPSVYSLVSRYEQHEDNRFDADNSFQVGCYHFAKGGQFGSTIAVPLCGAIVRNAANNGRPDGPGNGESRHVRSFVSVVERRVFAVSSAPNGDGSIGGATPGFSARSVILSDSRTLMGDHRPTITSIRTPYE
jgi:hypothetical protein